MDFDKPKVKVKLFYKACTVMTVQADTREEAHKKAYNEFMDSPSDAILTASEVELDFVETTIEGPEGSDMLHS
jgi:hypothetical protein